MYGSADIEPAAFPRPPGFDQAANPLVYASPAYPPTVYPPSAYRPPTSPPPVLAPTVSRQAMPTPLLAQYPSTSGVLLVSEGSKAESENGGATLTVILCALLFVIISVSALTVLLLGASLASPVTETKDQSDMSERVPPGAAPPMVVEVPVRAENPTTTTVESMTMTVELMTTTVESVTTTTSTPDTQRPETLLCAYGKRTRSDEVMAEDGLCDYAFFDSLYGNDDNTLTDRRRFGHDLRTFLRAAGRYTRTALGLAFAFHEMDRASADVRQTKQNELEEFWRMGIFHVGVLDTPESATGLQVVAAISLLKMFHGLASARGHPSITVLAAPTPDRQWAGLLADQGRVLISSGPESSFDICTRTEIDMEGRVVSGDKESARLDDYLLKNDDVKLEMLLARTWKMGYYPDFFVVHGHYGFGDNTVSPCAVMPPTRYSAIGLPDEFFQHYQYDLESAPFSIRELQAKNGSSRGLVSVTMKGRWTSPSPGQPALFYSRCDTNRNLRSFGSYTEVCADSNYAPQLEYKPDHYAMLTHHVRRRRAFAYDNEEGLCAKLCKVKGKMLDVNFGIAAYDVDFDDYVDECSSLNKFGAHSRLKTLRRIVDYYNSLANDDFDEKSCTSILT